MSVKVMKVAPIAKVITDMRETGTVTIFCLYKIFCFSLWSS
jgi:hypothetical protein